MNPFTNSLALASIVGSFTQIMASDTIDQQLMTIRNATHIERQTMIKELQSELKQMQEQERTKVMKKVQQEMPELANQLKKEDIAQKIKAIKSASPEQRMLLMNRFKKELAVMKKEERAEAIMQMRTEMAQQQSPGTHDKMHDQAENAQKDHIRELDRNEKTHQRDGANQYQQTIIQTGAQPGKGFGPN